MATQKQDSMAFELPKGVQIPDGKKVGDTFQAMGTFEILDGGKCELTEIDGESVNGEDTEPEDKSEPQDDVNASGVSGLFTGGGGYGS